ESMRTSAESLREFVSEKKALTEFESILALTASNSFELARYQLGGPVGPCHEVEVIRFAEQLLKSRSWRFTTGIRQAAAAIMGRKYSEPVTPSTVGEATQIIAGITG